MRESISSRASAIKIRVGERFQFGKSSARPVFGFCVRLQFQTTQILISNAPSVGKKAVRMTIIDMKIL